MGFWANVVGFFDGTWPSPPEPQTVAVQEATLGSGPGYDPDLHLSATQGGSAYMRRLSQSPRDLSPVTAARALELAYYLVDTNPLAKRIVELNRDLVVGDDVTVTAGGDDETLTTAMQEVIDAFWSDPFNRLDLTFGDKAYELSLTGEQCYPVSVIAANGSVRLGVVDPAAIDRVLCVPGAPHLPGVVVIKALAGAEEQWLKVIRVDDDPASTSFGRMVGLRQSETIMVGDEQKQYAGACFFFAVNKVSTATRGRGDLVPLIDWLDAYDSLMFSEIERAEFIKHFIWDIKLEGFTETQIASWLNTNGAPKPGAVRAHNEKVTWEAVAPDLHHADAQIGFDIVLSHIAAGAGLPKTWLAGVMDTNRATATELSEPAYKRLKARQKYVRDMFAIIITFVLDQAEIAGKLPKRPAASGMRPAPWSFNVNLPEMREKDLGTISTAVNQTATALATMRADGAIDQQVEQEAAALMLSQVGLDYDLEEMRTRVKKEEAVRKAEQEAMMLAGAPANANGNGAKPSLQEMYRLDEAGSWSKQPRVAAGSPRGGEWTDAPYGGGGVAAIDAWQARQAAATMTPAKKMPAAPAKYKDYSKGNPAGFDAQWQKWGDDLPVEEELAVRKYTSGSYVAINRSLRNPPPGDMDTISKIDAALSKGTLEHDVILHRGLSPNRLNLKPGDTFSDNAFISTSLGSRIAEQYATEHKGGGILQIRAPKGTKGAYVTPVSVFLAEREFLLPRGTKFRVVSVKKPTRPGDGPTVVVEIAA